MSPMFCASREPVYDESVTTEVENNGDDSLSGGDQAGDPEGSLYDQAVAIVTREEKHLHRLFNVICASVIIGQRPSLKKWKRMA